MSKIVRSSKFRHVHAEEKKDEKWLDIPVSKTGFDSNLVSCGLDRVAVVIDSQGGGKFVVFTPGQWGKWTDRMNENKVGNVVEGHTAGIFDIQFSPFFPRIIASCADDCNLMVWNLPDEPCGQKVTNHAQLMKGHSRKVGNMHWNPVANNVLASYGYDLKVKVWDVETGDAKLDITVGEQPNGIEWDPEGKTVLAVTKEKSNCGLKIVDPRANKVGDSFVTHQGTKGSRGCWFGADKIFSTGFTKVSEREVVIFDIKKASEPIYRQTIDQSAGQLMPFFDPDTNVLFLGGKGDGNIKYYEWSEDKLFFLSQYSSNVPTRGLGVFPKRACNISDTEIVRMAKFSTKDGLVLGFKVPRKSDVFQEDLYPDCYAGEHSVESGEWFGGKDGPVKKLKLGSDFDPTKHKKEAPSFKTVEKEEKEKTPAQLKKELDEKEKRIAYLEAELLKLQK